MVNTLHTGIQKQTKINKPQLIEYQKLFRSGGGKTRVWGYFDIRLNLVPKYSQSSTTTKVIN